MSLSESRSLTELKFLKNNAFEWNKVIKGRNPSLGKYRCHFLNLFCSVQRTTFLNITYVNITMLDKDKNILSVWTFSFISLITFWLVNIHTMNCIHWKDVATHWNPKKYVFSCNKKLWKRLRSPEAYTAVTKRVQTL